MAESEECTLESVIRGHHIYKWIWRPLVGKALTLERKEGNTQDRFAVSLLKDTIVVGHVPRVFSWVFWHFLRHRRTITCEVTGRRKRGKGLEIPCEWSLYTARISYMSGILVAVANYLQFLFSGVTLSLSDGGSLQC